MKISLKLPSTNAILKNIREKQEATVDILYKEIRQLVSGRPLTRSEQQRHPFSRRNPGVLSPLVHIRTGKLLNSLKKDSTGVKIDERRVPYVKYIVDGTSRMIPRDFITAAINKAAASLGKIWSSK